MKNIKKAIMLIFTIAMCSSFMLMYPMAAMADVIGTEIGVEPFGCLDDEHVWDSGKVTKEATETKTGEKTFTCTACGATKIETIPVLAHTHKYTAKVTKATLEKNGKVSGTCSVCGNKTETIVYAVDAVKLSWTSTTYNGNTKKPAVTVTDTKGKKLTADTDYTVKYASGRKNVGSYKVTVKGIGNYSFTEELTFKIKAAGIDTAKLSYTAYKYTGKAKTPVVTVVDKNGKTLAKDKDYTVKYASGRKEIGTYKVTVKGKGNYSFTKTLTFKINPQKPTLSSVTKKSKTSITVKWKKVSNTTGYQIKYVKADGTYKTLKVKGASTVSKVLTELKKGETYKVSIRTYKTVSGATYYSAYSTAKSVSLK